MKLLPKKLPIYVNQDDIDDGIPCVATRCMVSRCVYRTLREKYNIKASRVRTTAAGIHIVIGDTTTIYCLTTTTAKRIRGFDEEQTAAHPFSTVLLRAGVRKLTPVDPARKAQINARRNDRYAAAKALGIKPTQPVPRMMGL